MSHSVRKFMSATRSAVGGGGGLGNLAFMVPPVTPALPVPPAANLYRPLSADLIVQPQFRGVYGQVAWCHGMSLAWDFSV